MPQFRSLLSRLALIALAADLTSACAVGPDYQRPDLKLTPSYMAAPVTTQAPGAPIEAWWAGFNDPMLTEAVQRASAQNLDVQQAGARISQARAAAKAAGAALAPRLDANGAAASVSQSLLSPIGQIGSHLPGFPRDLDDYQLGAAASWEIDLFGGLRRERQAAQAEVAAAQADGAAVRVSIAAETADAYLQVRALQDRLAVARRQEQTQLDLTTLLQQRVGEGVSPERELHEAQAALLGVHATIPPLNAALDGQLNRLDVLMGAQPGTYRAELAAPQTLPTPPHLSIAEGPADLLRRRPDVAAAEQRLIAANAGIGAAIADYYPKVSVSALLGYDSTDSSRLFSPLALQHQVAGGVGWRLFDFGRVDAEVAAAKGRKAEALAAWRGSVFKAAEEVEDALANAREQQARADALSRQITELTTARGQSEQAYEGGVISLVEVRDADRDLLAALDQLVQAKAAAARATVAAYRALGGGWSAPVNTQVARR